MKYFSKISALILSTALTINTGLLVNAIEEPIIDGVERQFTGYTFNDSVAAVIFDSWSDYQTYSPAACEEMKNDTYECYMKNHDYIYVPKCFEDKTDSISNIFITPRYCLLTFSINNREIEFCHYFSDDGKDYCYDYTSFAEKFGSKTVVGSTLVYKYGNKCYYKFDGSYFSVSTNFEFQSENDIRVVKIYTDSHFEEQNGSLFYIADNGTKENGWKTLNGHNYYFRSADKTAICGKKAEIGGIVYSFNQNGICKGTYTGYALRQNGTRVYYKDGKIQETSSNK